jgi:hypothetical protein
MDRVGIWHALPYISARLRALVLGALRFAWMRRFARTALIVSAATYIPQGILLFVWSVKTLSAVERSF